MRFFGPAPVPTGDWEDVPPAKLANYANALPRLKAEESLRLMTDLAAGTGVMEKQSQGQYRSELTRAANGGVVRGQKATRESLAAASIQIVERG